MCARHPRRSPNERFPSQRAPVDLSTGAFFVRAGGIRLHDPRAGYGFVLDGCLTVMYTTSQDQEHAKVPATKKPRVRRVCVVKWRTELALGMLLLLVLAAPLLVHGQETTGPPAAPRSSEGGKTDGAKPPDRAMQAAAYYELGLMYHERVFESLDQAIAQYEKAVKAQPDYADAHFNLALSYHTKAKLGTDDKMLYRKAVAEYKLYLKYSPKGDLADKAKQNIRVLEARLRQ